MKETRICVLNLLEFRVGLPTLIFPSQLIKKMPIADPLSSVVNTEILSTSEDVLHESLDRVSSLLGEGQVVGFPTETVYGLAANALDGEAVGRIYKAKGRPSDNPLIVHISSLDMLSSLVDPAALESVLSVYGPVLKDCWPGPLTILAPKSSQVPDIVTGGHQTVAIRMPSHPIALALINACGFPLAAPSANTSGRPSPTLASHVFQDLQGRIPLILDGGPCTCGIESTVLDGLRSPPVILRPGGLTPERLCTYPGMEGLQVYQKTMKGLETMESTPTTPGMKYRHYKPDAQVILFEPGASKSDQRRSIQSYIDESRDPSLKIGILRSEIPVTISPTTQSEFYLGSTMEEIAAKLFQGLRWMEEEGVQIILVEGTLEKEQGFGIMNRLKKAASEIISLSSSPS